MRKYFLLGLASFVIALFLGMQITYAQLSQSFIDAAYAASNPYNNVNFKMQRIC
jgi:hypothetical protein